MVSADASITFADEPHGAATYAQSRAVLQEAPPHETDPKAHTDDKISKRKTRRRMKRKKSRWTGGMQRKKEILKIKKGTQMTLWTRVPVSA